MRTSISYGNVPSVETTFGLAVYGIDGVDKECEKESVTKHCSDSEVHSVLLVLP